jgi:RND family efflux transporter MFP subunit
MLKKNLLGIVIVILIAAAFVGGYLLGKGSAPQMSQGQRMAMMGGQQPGSGGQPPADQPGNTGQGPPGQPEGNPGQQQQPIEQPDRQNEQGETAGQRPQTGQPPEGQGGEPGQRPATATGGNPGSEDMTEEMQAMVMKAREEGKSREEIQAMIAKMREENSAGQPTSDAQPSAQPRPAASLTPEKSANTPEFYGTAAPSAEVNVQSKQGGTIIMLKGKEGDTVRQGETLVRFDDSEQQLNLEKARSAKSATLQQVKQAEANLKAAQTTLERNQQLFSEGLISQQQMDDLQNKVEVAQSSLDNARENAKQADTQIALLENGLENFVVRAPISGIINAKNYNLQEIYRANDVIYHIMNIDEVYVNVDVPETYIKQIREGMQASATFNALGDQEFLGVVETILPSGSTANRTFTAKVLVKNPEQAIKPGMFASVELTVN